MKGKILIDSYTILSYLRKEGNYKSVKELFKSESVQILVNEIEIGRVFTVLAQERGMEKAEYFLQQIIPTLPIKHVGNTYDDVIEAARIKSAHSSLSYLNCLTIVTAAKEDALLVSENPEFRGIDLLIKFKSLEEKLA